MSDSDVIGRCPVCSEQLLLDGEYLVCSDHYKITRIAFDTAWDAFDKVFKKAKEQEQKHELGHILMRMLLDNNVAINKVEVKPIGSVHA